jgi:hypothetical protein
MNQDGGARNAREVSDGRRLLRLGKGLGFRMLGLEFRV